MFVILLAESARCLKNVCFVQVLAHVGVSGPGVPAGAVRAERRVLRDGVLARADAARVAPVRGRSRRAAAAAQTLTTFIFCIAQINNDPTVLIDRDRFFLF